MATEVTASKKLKSTIYELIYKKGGSLHTIYFEWDDKVGAIKKGQEYCEVKNLKFITVNEWLQDIQALISHGE